VEKHWQTVSHTIPKQLLKTVSVTENACGTAAAIAIAAAAEEYIAYTSGDPLRKSYYGNFGSVTREHYAALIQHHMVSPCSPATVKAVVAAASQRLQSQRTVLLLLLRSDLLLVYCMLTMHTICTTATAPLCQQTARFAAITRSVVCLDKLLISVRAVQSCLSELVLSNQHDKASGPGWLQGKVPVACRRSHKAAMPLESCC
jgi:hypothetical protein